MGWDGDLMGWDGDLMGFNGDLMGWTMLHSQNTCAFGKALEFLLGARSCSG